MHGFVFGDFVAYCADYFLITCANDGCQGNRNSKPICVLEIHTIMYDIWCAILIQNRLYLKKLKLFMT